MAPKGKAKAKKPLSAKAKAKLREAKRVAKEEAIARGEIPAVAPKKNDPFKLKILKELGGKSIAEASAEFKKNAMMRKAELQEAEAMEKAQQNMVDEANKEVQKAKDEISSAQNKELEAAKAYKDIVGQRSEITKKVEEARKELYEQQKKVAMLEVLAVNHAKMKALEETRRQAQQAAEEAKKNMLEQKAREKEALEATRRALAETRAEQKGLGAKRKKIDHPDQADTLPATLPDNSAADID